MIVRLDELAPEDLRLPVFGDLLHRLRCGQGRGGGRVRSLLRKGRRGRKHRVV